MTKKTYSYVADADNNVVALFDGEFPEGIDLQLSYMTMKTSGTILSDELDLSLQYKVKRGKLSIRTDGSDQTEYSSMLNRRAVNKAKMKRNELLAQCDWTMMSDVPFTEEQKTLWKEYRQALRDITDQDGFPTNVVWPEPPK